MGELRNRDTSDDGQLTDDAVLGGRLRLLQPQRGHRVGHDAILLAAAVKARAGEHAVDLGAGVGAAGLALALRVPGLKVTLVEIEPALASLAAENSRRNDLRERVQVVTLDVAAPARSYAASGAGARQCRSSADEPAVQRSAAAATLARTRAAHCARRRNGSRSDARRSGCAPRRGCLRPAGSLTLIWRADGLAEVLASCERGFGEIAVLPVHPAPAKPAIRILVRAVKGSRAPLVARTGPRARG